MSHIKFTYFRKSSLILKTQYSTIQTDKNRDFNHNKPQFVILFSNKYI